MTLELGKLDCLAGAGNTGVGACFLDIKKIVGAFFAPKGYELDLTMDLQTQLVDATCAPSKANRLFPIFDFKALTDGTEKPVIQTFPDGSKAYVRDGFNDWMFQFINGGASLTKELRKFSKYAYDFFFIDADGKLLGIDGSDDTKLRAFPSDGGYQLTLPWKPSDGSKVTEYMIQFVFNSKYTTDQINFVYDDSFDIVSTIKGLQNVIVTGVPETVAVGATATDTIVIGSTNDTIFPKLSGIGLTASTVTQTSSETTATLLAAKIVGLINSNVGSNGGITATNLAGVITYTSSPSNGATTNGLTVTHVITGTITATPTAFSGGVTGGTRGAYDITLKTEATKSNLYDLFAEALATGDAFIATNDTTGQPVAITSVAAGSSTAKTFKVQTDIADVNYPSSGQKMDITLALPLDLQGLGVYGYEAIAPASMVKN